MIFNAFPCAPVSWQPELDHLYVATAPQWNGEYTRRSDLGPLVRHCAGCGAEDPFIWRSRRGYHLLLHTLGGGGGGAVGGVAFSKDGLTWSSHPDSISSLNPPYPDTVSWANGSSTQFHR